MTKAIKIVEEVIRKYPELENALYINISSSLINFHISKGLFLNLGTRYPDIIWEVYFVMEGISIQSKLFEIEGISVVAKCIVDKHIFE